MEIIFDERPGEIYDIFQSLWVINNYDYVQKRKPSLNIKEVNSFEKSLKCLIKESKIDEERLTKYFCKEIEPKNVLILSNLWKFKTIDKYLEYITNIDDNEVWNFIIQIIDSITGDKEEEIIESKVNMDLESMINFINTKNIDNSIKWEMLMLLNDKERYISEFVKFIEEYLKIYTKLNEKRQIIMENLNKVIKGNIEDQGMGYLNKLVSGIFNFEGYEKIYVTTSVLSNLIIADEYSNDCFLILGPYFKQLQDSADESCEIDESLNFIKNICESTRFKIIKMLLERDYYGLEIAKELGLTKATVSYHMDFLVTAKVTYIKKEGQKIYYSLNKEVLKESVEFLKKEFRI